jgi:glucose/arabinose dehydrogenase
MTFYSGPHFPGWEGDLFVGALAGRHLRRVRIRNDRVVEQEVLLSGVIGRIRDVRLGPDGKLYILTDERNGGLYRIDP